MTERHPCVANRLRTSLFVGAIGLALWACGPTPAPRPTTPSPAATSPRLTPAQASAAEGARLVSQESGCLAHWTPACGDLAIRFRRDCPLPLRDEKRLDVCAMIADQLEAAGARAVCNDGSVADCTTACDAGGNMECLELAHIYQRGSRVVKDERKALSLAAAVCDRGVVMGCLQRGMWLRGRDAARAASSLMKACAGDVPGTVVACAQWFEDVDERRYAPAEPELVAGLEHVCAAERKGTLHPNSLIMSAGVTVRYEGGACGRLKDLGRLE